MADLDFFNDKTPVLAFKKPSSPTISQLKSALTTFNSTSYTPARLQTMTENDLVYAARLHGLTVAASQSV
jgi:hypothetical protein